MTEVKKKRYYKNMFHQSAEMGVPSHWVVQYVVEGDGFVSVEYCETEDEACNFAQIMIAENSTNNKAVGGRDGISKNTLLNTQIRK